MGVGHFAIPLVELGQRVEVSLLAVVLIGIFFKEHFDDGRDELLDDRATDHRGPEMVQKVDDKSFDMRPIHVLNAT